MSSAPWSSLSKSQKVDSLLGNLAVGYHLGGIALPNPHILTIHQYVNLS
jgi:hypothetical protein